MATVHEMDHPLIKHKLALMRDKTTGVKEFREAAAEIAMLMCYEATRDLPLKEITIETPVAEARVQVISGKKIALVPILRAGLGMVEGILRDDSGSQGRPHRSVPQPGNPAADRILLQAAE